MEKFTTWRDPATGIHPFLPITLPKEWSIGSLIYGVVGLVLGGLRIPIFTGLLLVWMIILLGLSVISGFLPPGLAYSLLRVVDSVLGHAILFSLGFFYIPVRRMGFRPGSGEEIVLTLARAGGQSDQVYPGDLIIANSQSPLDILILCTKFSPTFTVVDPISKRPHACSRWHALLNCMMPGGSESGHTSGLSRILLTSHSPVVVFPEGTTSNGRALLLMVADFTKIPPNQRIHLLGFKYVISDGGFQPTLPVPGVKNLAIFLWSLSNQVPLLSVPDCTHLTRPLHQWFNTVSIKWINSRTLYSSKHLPAPADDTFNRGLSSIFQVLLHTRSVTLSLREKAEFLKAYFGTLRK